eukprot:5921530-Amphidinium_carterae.1
MFADDILSFGGVVQFESRSSSYKATCRKDLGYAHMLRLLKPNICCLGLLQDCFGIGDVALQPLNCLTVWVDDKGHIGVGLDDNSILLLINTTQNIPTISGMRACELRGTTSLHHPCGARQCSADEEDIT